MASLFARWCPDNHGQEYPSITASQIKVIIDNAIEQAKALAPQVKAKALELLNALKQLVPVVPKIV